MEAEIRMVDLTKDNVVEFSCCAIKNPKHEGHRRKSSWIETHFGKGFRLKTLLGEKNVQFGTIEYLPGEYAWRGVEASGYMFVHCVWTYSRKLKGTGLGSRLIRAAVDDAKKAGMNGIAALTRRGPWLAGSAVFLKNGFEIVDKTPPDYELLAFKFKKSAPNPVIKQDWGEKREAYGRGLTIIRSNQCPHIAKFADDIAEMARTTYKLSPRIVDLKNYREAQNAPTPYAVFSIILDGRILADHPISATRFRNIMNGLTVSSKPIRTIKRAKR